MISFALFSLVGAISLGAALFYSIGWKRAERRAVTAEKAYAELTAQSAVRERGLRNDLNREIAAHGTTGELFQSALRKLACVEEDARLLAVTVRQYAKDIRETMVLMKDETAPKELVAAEEALRLHDEQLKLRSQT